MNRVTLCLAYYENPGMLRRQFEAIAELKPWVREQLELIVVDDGSPTKPAADVDRVVVKLGRAGDTEGAAPLLSSFRLFRMGVDVPWNMDACRNLAVSQAVTDWVLLTDIDHLVPEKTWIKILTASLNPRQVYKFGRVSEPDLAPYKPHPNTWLMTREIYDRAGGYDERLAGWYGTDGDFRNAVQKVAPVVSFKEPIVRVPREVTPDASTTTLTRRSPENAAGLDRAKEERAKIKGWRPLRNSFPWVQVI
jgi:hypothetical protein